MKINLLLDIDGVLANFYAGFGDYLNKTHNAGLDLSVEPASYIFEEWGPGCSKINMDKAAVDWIMKDGFRNTPVYDGAKDFVKELHTMANIYVVTARIGDFKQKFGDHVVEKIKSDTANWFKDNKIPTESVIFNHKKIDFCKDNAIPALIEDKLETALLGAKEGVHSILIDRAWNEHPDRHRVYRADDYEHALGLLRKIKQ